MSVTFDPKWEITRYLKDRDVACPRCGYNLRDLETDVCPECRLLLRIEALRRMARRGPTSQVRAVLPWIGGLLGALSLWGFVIWIVWRSMRMGGGLPSWFNACVLVSLLVVVAPVVVGAGAWVYRARAEDRKYNRHRD